MRTALRPFLALCIFACCLLPFAARADFAVEYHFTDFTQQPQPNRPVYITPLWTVNAAGTNFLTPDRAAYTADASASLIVSNFSSLVSAAYRVEFYGRFSIMQFTNYFPTNLSGLVNGKDYVTLPTGVPAAYSTTQSDARYVIRAGDTAYNLSFLKPTGLSSTNTGTIGQVYKWLTSATGYWATLAGTDGIASNNGSGRYNLLTNPVVRFIGPSQTTTLTTNGNKFEIQTDGDSDYTPLSFDFGQLTAIMAGFDLTVGTFDADGSIRNYNNSGGLDYDGLYGLAFRLTNGSPTLATNHAAATDGMALVKRGTNLNLESFSIPLALTNNDTRAVTLQYSLSLTNENTTNTFRGKFQQGAGTIASGANSHAEGEGTAAVGTSAHSEGLGTVAAGAYSHSEGILTIAEGSSSHSAGRYANALADRTFMWNGIGSATWKTNDTAGSFQLWAPGGINLWGGVISGDGSGLTNLSGANIQTSTINSNKFDAATLAAIGGNTQNGLTNNDTREVIFQNNVSVTNTATTNTFRGRFQQGAGTIASGANSHAEGEGTAAVGTSAHSEGLGTVAAGAYSHSEGILTIAEGSSSHSAGRYANALADRTFMWNGIGSATWKTNDTAGSFQLWAPGGINLWGGVISGDGSGLTNLGAAVGWSLTGNSGLSSTNFIGNTDAVSLTLKVNGGAVASFDTNQSVILGSYSNTMVGWTPNSTIAGGTNNSINSPYNVSYFYDQGFNFIGGGETNLIYNNVGGHEFIGGGLSNRIYDSGEGYNAIVGGNANRIYTNAYSFIGGGLANTVSNNANYGTIPGGSGNLVAGSYGFAAGRNAQAMHAGAFVWGDSQSGTVSSSAADTFTVRARGGLFFNGAPVTVGSNLAVSGSISGFASGISNAPPAIGTNGATATDGWVLTKSGTNLTWVAAAPGSGDALVADGLDQFAATTSAELAGVISDETGTAGQLVFSGSPTLATPTLSGNTTAGTINNTTIPSSATLVKASDTVSALTAAASSVWAGEITDETGSGSVVFSVSPSLTTPSLGNASATTINGTPIPSGATLVETLDTLAVFAATTSTQLGGVISDETGSGALVFGTQPTLARPTIQTGTIELGYRQVASVGNNPNANFAYQLSSISTNANFNITVQNASSNQTLQVIYTNTSSSWITGTLSSTFSVLGGGTGITATAIALAPTNITHVKYWTDRLTNYFMQYESGIPNLSLDSLASISPTAGDSLIYHATVGWTNIAGFDSYTNTWTADTPLVLGRTNYYATSGAATIGITGVGNLPANVQRSTELTVLATGTVVFTNVAGIRTSDFVNSRTLTNGNVMVIGLTVIPGRSTNMALAQFRAQ